MMEIVNNIKDFVSYYNALVKEIERITPLKKGIESVLKSDCDCVYYENKEIDKFQKCLNYRHCKKFWNGKDNLKPIVMK